MQQFYASLALSLAITAGGCQRATPGYWGQVELRHPADRLRLPVNGEPEYIDPGTCTDELGAQLASNMFAGLVDVHPVTLMPVPELAERWEVGDGGRTYTFYLRPSSWSDGVPVTAADFVAAWRRVLDPATASRSATLLQPLVGAEAFARGALWLTSTPPLPTATLLAHAQARWSPDRAEAGVGPAGAAGVYAYPADDGDAAAWRRRALADNGQSLNGAHLQVVQVDGHHVGVEAPSPHVLRVRLQTPVHYFLQLLTHYTFRPVPGHLLARLRAAGIDPARWTEPEHLVVNGPFRLTLWQFKRRMLLEKNPRYWDAEHVALQQVELTVVENVATMMNLYRTGDLDWTASDRLPSEFLPSLRAYRDTHLEPVIATSFLWLNAHRPPLDRLPLRRALALAIDRQALTRQVLRGGQVPTADLVPPGLPGYPDRHSPLFDPQAARQQLAAAGYPGGDGLPPLTLIYNTAEVNRQVAESVQAMWQEHLGIQVDLANQEWKVYLQNMADHDFQIGRMAWSADYPDANAFLHDVLSTQAGVNHAAWHDPGFDGLLRQASLTESVPARQALLRQAEDRAMAAQPLIPLFVAVHSYMQKPYVRGIYPNPQARHPWRHISLDPGWRSAPASTSAPAAASKWAQP